MSDPTAVTPAPPPPEQVAATFAKLHPKEYHRKFLALGVRPDGRSLNTVRSTQIAADSIPSSSGSSLVKIGQTSVVCALKLEIGRPFDTKPQDGRLGQTRTVVEVHLTPLCSPKFKVGRATEQAVALSQWLTNAIINMWVIYADIVCLNYDGNLYDACLLALVQSLKKARLPEVEIVEDGLVGGDRSTSKSQSEVCISSVNTRPLPFYHSLISTTFGVLDQHLLADPTAAEEDLLSGQLTIVLNEKVDLCQVHKAGGVPLTDAQIQQCIQIAKTRLPILLPLLT